MLNLIWPIFIIISFTFAIFSGNIEQLNTSIFQSTQDAIQLSIDLLGTICLWNGVMQIANETSMIEKLTKFFEPIINFLFPELKTNKKIKKEISMNVVANVLGLGNAATPLGLKAMQSMQDENLKKDTVTDSMMTLLY